MATCKGKTKTGKRCQAPAGPGGFCAFHSPEHAAARAAGRRRGGERSHVPHVADTAMLPTDPRTIDDARKILSYALQETVALENSVQRGRLLCQIAAGLVQAVQAGELEQRLAAIEAALKEQGEHGKS